MATIETAKPIPWWKEPTKDQWHAWVAAWLGWTLDAFDFTIFLLIMLPIAQEFNVPLTAVTAVFTLTLWMRLVGATASGWLADRVGRKTPLMISIAWYSVCNLIAGLSPTFWFLFLFRALLGIGMGAEWPAGAALAMESWPIRSRGFMAGVLQSSWGLGALLSSAAYGLLYNSIGWRGLLILGVLPALLLVYIRFFVKEPAVWVENRRLQRVQKREVRLPLFSIFKRGMLGNTLTACWWMASGFVVGYSIGGLFPTYLQKDLHLSPGLVALPIMLQSVLFFLSGSAWGWVADRIGRRWAMILPAMLRNPSGSPLPAHHQLHDDRRVFCPAGAICRGRHLWSKPELSRRAVSDRGARYGSRLLLSPGRNLWRPGGAGSRLSRHRFASGFRHSDDGRDRWAACVSFIAALLVGPGNQGQGLGADLVVA